MKRWGSWVFTLAALLISTVATSAQTKSGIDKLYILNCGEGVAGDISRWSPGVNVGKSMDFVDNCYLIHHPQGWCFGTLGSQTP
jgi:N-acyl homoserine lactone hydrolase